MRALSVGVTRLSEFLRFQIGDGPAGEGGGEGAEGGAAVESEMVGPDGGELDVRGGAAVELERAGAE